MSFHLSLTPDELAALAEIEWLLSGPHTLDAIALHLGWSKEYVRRIEMRALTKMRRAARYSKVSGIDFAREPMSPPPFSVNRLR